MKILSVDTSSANCSVAIVEVDKNNFNIIITDNNSEEKTHSQKLMPMIDNMFKISNLTLNDIDLLACCLGPGSFTGIRIGIATLKAFADAKNIPTVGVTSLESLSYNIEDNSFILPIIDAKNNNVYSALFSHSNNNYIQIGNNIAENINNCLDNFISLLDYSFNKITFIGNGSTLYKNLIEDKFKNLNYELIFSNDNIQNSVSLSKCAYIKYLNNEFGDSNNISPLYLRKSQAEREKYGEK